MKKAEKAEVTDEELVGQINQGNTALQELLFDRYIHRLLRYVLVFVKSSEEAKDLTQEVLIKVFEALPHYRPTGKFESWVFTIARRFLIDYHRKNKIKTLSIDADEVADQTQELTAGSSQVADLISVLPVKKREVIQLRFVEGLSYKEISEITGLVQGSLRNMVSDCVKKMQKEHLNEL